MYKKGLYMNWHQKCRELSNGNHTLLRVSGCNINKNIPPATETLRDSKPPAIGMLTSLQACTVCFDNPCPSLPNTKQRGSPANDSASSLDNERVVLDPSALLPGWPANIFILFLVFKVIRWDHVPETTGSWKEAPRDARSAFSFKGSQQLGSRKAPSCV